MKRNTMNESHSSGSAPSPTKKTSPSAAATTSPSCFNREILEEIFLNVPPHQVVSICRLVCCQWKEVADSESFWRVRCRREGILWDPSKVQDWRLFYFLSKKRRNMIKNPRGEEGLNGWEILENGGDMWATGPIRKPHPDETVRTNFITSFEMCMKSQLVDLEKEGYNSAFMDKFQPDIQISDWIFACLDCGSRYDMRVELLNQKKKVVQIFAPETIFLSAGYEVWKKVTHVFQNYGGGVRYVRFTHGGKDSRWWKGHYGVHITDTRVEIFPTQDI